MTQKKRVLVVGATGFVGSHVCARLSEAGLDVIAATRSEGGEFSWARSRVVVPDTGNFGSWLVAMERVDAVVNVAGLAHSRSAGKAEYYSSNVQLPAVLADAAVRVGVPTFIHLSSVAAATHATALQAGRREPTDRDPYAVSKLEGEEGVLTRSDGATVMIALRAPMVYGPRMRGNPLRLFDHIMRRRPLTLARYENARSVLYAGNLADAIAAIVLKVPVRPGVYPIADAYPISTRAFANAAARALGRQANIIPVPARLLRILGYAGDLLSAVTYSPVTSRTIEGLVDSLVVDDSTFRADFSWTPPVDFNAAIAFTGAWYLSEQASIDESHHHSKADYPANGQPREGGKRRLVT